MFFYKDFAPAELVLRLEFSNSSDTDHERRPDIPLYQTADQTSQVLLR
jgi:hypothetical protein